MTTVADRMVDSAAPPMLSAELSVLEFQRRVLALANDPATPLAARLRFIGIVASNIDEFYMLRMPAILRDAAENPDGVREDDRLSAADRRARIAQSIDELLGRQALYATECLAEARRHGVSLCAWNELSEGEHIALRQFFREELHPALSPFAMTMSPGHPLPHLPHLALSLAIVLRNDRDGHPHLAEVEIPDDLPRIIDVPSRAGAYIWLEDVLRANADLLHPNARVESVHLFRVTRRGDLALDEAASPDLLAAVHMATQRRPYNQAIRVELERDTPPFVANLIVESLRRDAAVQGAVCEVHDVQIVSGILDLRCLASLPLPRRDELEYPALHAASPVSPDDRMFDVIRERDLLVHHPYTSFDDTVVRFIREAAEDAGVTTIKMTLYRVGDPAPVVEALLAAAANGKRVIVFVELKARFDEEHNVSWSRALERAGGHVVYGIIGIKTHAKVALVVRKEEGRLQRYVHVGTGNYNTRSGKQYTDLSLFSAREDIGADVADLFNELTGSSGAPRGLSRGALVAPIQLLPALLNLIATETLNARAGMRASITIKANGLSDADVIAALYEASEAGVEIELVVRGICTLTPGVDGLSSRIRVRSVVGRFLEHSRIYRLENGGHPRYFIGSADLRPRNLRRRVELLVPITDDAHCQELDAILDGYMRDERAWQMECDGRYVQRRSSGAAEA